MSRIQRCILTDRKLNHYVKFDESNPLVIDYKFPPVGRVRIVAQTHSDLLRQGQSKNLILAGICRNSYENGEEPPLIDDEFLTTTINNYKYPTEFEEKAIHLLKHLYYKGGKVYKEFNYSSQRDYTLCYCADLDEFNRIMKLLADKNFAKWKESMTLGLGNVEYNSITLTALGIAEIEKDLPAIPLIGLVNQKISTGDLETDNKINHAQDLFFQEPRTFDKMRSACETLSYVLEPLRKDLEKYFSQKDVNDFFQIVNTFDIRHNKDSTKNIHHQEQLEWVYYSLLNTINTYTKLQRKFVHKTIW